MSRSFRPNRRSAANRGRGRALLVVLFGAALVVALWITAMSALSEEGDGEGPVQGSPGQGALPTTTGQGVPEEQVSAESTNNGSTEGSGEDENAEDENSDESPDVDQRAAEAARGVEDATGPEFSVHGEPRRAVAAYVVSAYGYTGSDATAYVRGVEEGVIYPDFHDSAGGDFLRSRVSAIENGGMQSAARLTDFRISSQSEDRVVGTAFYEIGQRYEGSGSRRSGEELAGETASYSERITLVFSGEGSSSEGYRVLSASGPEEAADSQ